MKRLFLVGAASLYLSGMAVAQKSNIREAKSLMSQTPPGAEAAKAKIDAALLDESTKNSAETWYIRGQVYTALKCGECFRTAYESFQKAEELDIRNEYKIKIETREMLLLGQELFNYGVDRYQASDYTGSLAAFELFTKISPSETAGYQNAAMSAENGGDYGKASKFYRELITRNSANDKTYESLSKALMQQKDTAGALAVLKEGKFAYPDSMGLLIAEINILLSADRGNEALSSLQQVVVKDPNNVSCYLSIGIIHLNMAHPTDKEGNALSLPSDHQLQLSQAEEAYRKGLSLDPNHFELNFNLGVLYFNEGVEFDKAANAKNVSDAEYNRLTAESAKRYAAAEPFLEKAATVRPTDVDVLNSLKMLYLRTKETDKYAKVNSTLQQLQR